MSEKTGQDDFETITDYMTREARWFALDAMACTFHNHGYYLNGNNEQNDARWLAGSLSQALDFGRRLEDAPEERQKELLKMARVAIKLLPGLCDRIASRYIRLAGAIKLHAAVAREQAQQMQNAKRTERQAKTDWDV
jgi:hypothetical protein